MYEQILIMLSWLIHIVTWPQCPLVSRLSIVFMCSFQKEKERERDVLSPEPNQHHVKLRATQFHKLLRKIQGHTNVHHCEESYCHGCFLTSSPTLLLQVFLLCGITSSWSCVWCTMPVCSPLLCLRLQKLSPSWNTAWGEVRMCC